MNEVALKPAEFLTPQWLQKKPPLRHFISGVLGLNGLELASQRGAQTGHGRQDQSGF